MKIDVLPSFFFLLKKQKRRKGGGGRGYIALQTNKSNVSA